MKKLFLAAAVATSMAIAPAHAGVTFVFKGDNGNVTPEGTLGADFVTCASSGDFCSTGDHADGLVYELSGVELTARAFANGTPTRIIQDRNPGDSGLGAFSETGDPAADQTQADSGESIEFSFTTVMEVTDVEFNAGGDRNCTAAIGGGGEGECGSFRLTIFDLNDMLLSDMIIDITSVDMLPVLGTGARFVLEAIGEGAGFTVAQLTVTSVPIPGAIPLLLSGIAGLGFASRKKRTA